MEETRTVAEIVNSFNDSLNESLRMLDRRITDIAGKALVGRLRSRLSIVRSVANGRQLILERAGPMLYRYHIKILDRDEDFFMRVDVRSEYGDKIAPEEEFVYDLIAQIRALYSRAKEVERDALYNLVLSMLTDWIGFCLVTKREPDAE